MTMTTVDTPTCPKHGAPLLLLEEGVLNGVTVRYWGRCPGTPGKAPPVCEIHEADPFAEPRQCSCRTALRSVCKAEARTEEIPAGLRRDEPSLF